MTMRTKRSKWALWMGHVDHPPPVQDLEPFRACQSGHDLDHPTKLFLDPWRDVAYIASAHKCRNRSNEGQARASRSRAPS